MLETQKSLFPICCRLPKLDVAGSTPVSRSSFQLLGSHRVFHHTPFTPLSSLDPGKCRKGHPRQALYADFFRLCFRITPDSSIHYSLLLLIEIGISVDGQTDAEPVPSLVGRDLGSTPNFLESVAFVRRST